MSKFHAQRRGHDTAPLEPKGDPIPMTPLLEADLPPLRSGHDLIAAVTPPSRTSGNGAPGEPHLCRACGKPVRSYNPDCKGCAPPLTAGRRRVRDRGVQVFRSKFLPSCFQGHALRPKTTSEAIAALGNIAAVLASGAISAHVARLMVFAIRVQCRLLIVQEDRLWQLKKEKEVVRLREALRRRYESLRTRQKERARRALEEARKKRAAQAASKRGGGKPVREVPSIGITDVERRLAESEGE